MNPIIIALGAAVVGFALISKQRVGADGLTQAQHDEAYRLNQAGLAGAPAPGPVGAPGDMTPMTEEQAVAEYWARMFGPGGDDTGLITPSSGGE